MEVQILKFRLTEQESAQLLPQLLSAIAGTSTIALEEMPQPEVLPEPAPPVALPAPASDPELIQIAPPTGSPKTAQTLVWDAQQNGFVKPKFWQRWQKQHQQFQAWWRKYSAYLSATIGAAMGLSAIAYALHAGWLHNPLAKQETVLPVESLATEETAEPAPVAPPRPGDASSKAGIHGDRPPMQKGAIEDD